MCKTEWSKNRQSNTRTYMLLTFSIVWLAILAAFFSYFVVLNSTDLILYTLIGFIMFGVLLAVKSSYIFDSVLLAIVLILSSSIAYMGLLDGYIYPYAIFAIVFTAIASSSLLKLRPKHKAYIVLFLTLLVLLSVVPSKANFIEINVAIVGYYMLISAVLALFINNVDAGKRLHKTRLWLNSIMDVVWQNNRVIGVFVLIGIVLLVSPIWYSGQVRAPIEISAMPYANLTLYNMPKSGLYPIKLNASYYAYLINSKMSNIRIYAIRNGTVLVQHPIDLYLQNSSILPEYVSVLAGLNTSYHDYRIYFLPTNINSSNTTYGRLMMLNSSTFYYLESTSTTVPYSLGSIAYHNLSYVNKSISVLLSKRTEYNHSENVTVPSFYSVKTLCPQGGAGITNASVSFKSNSSISAFFLGSINNFTESVNEVAGITWYPSVLHIFLEHSFMSKINGTNMGFNLYLPANNGCIFYVITGEDFPTIRIYKTLRYNESYLLTSTYMVPKVVLPQRQHALLRFITGGEAYVYRTYTKMLNSSS